MFDLISYLIDNILQLQDRYTNKSIFTCETIITDANVQLIKVKLFLRCCVEGTVKASLRYKNYSIRNRWATYKWKVSLYFGDQLFVFDFVAILRFLSWRCGPVRLISTYGRNTTPDGLAHFRSFAAITKNNNTKLDSSTLFKKLTFNCDFMFSRTGLCKQIHLHRHFSYNLIIHISRV